MALISYSLLKIEMNLFKLRKTFTKKTFGQYMNNKYNFSNKELESIDVSPYRVVKTILSKHVKSNH